MMAWRSARLSTHFGQFWRRLPFARSYATNVNRAVRILEVGPRDGLQNIKTSVPTELKVELIQRLQQTGLRDIEATSFVSPKWVPQLADGAQVMSQVLQLEKEHGTRLPVLAPNLKGLQNAAKSNVSEVVVFASATEAFSKKNQNCSVDEALAQAEQVAQAAREKDIKVRGVISCIFSDPYIAGKTDPESVLKVAQRFLDMGCHEVGLGDTLGVGTPYDTSKLLEVLLKYIPENRLAGHFHDTYGQAVANVWASYNMGIRSFDSSVAGLGGCPYAPGAKGNAATEDIVYSFEEAGISTGIDIQKLAEVGAWISDKLKLPNNSRAGAALAAKARQASATASSKPETNSTRSWREIENTGEFKVERTGAAVKITLTRPQKGNSMTPAMLEGLTEVYERFAKDRTVFHIILTAEGRFFCTGMDLGGGTDRTSKTEEESYYGKVRRLFDAVDNSPQTTIAVLDGPAFGGGVGLTFACDVRIVTKKAKWTLSEVKLGLSPAIISIYMAREWGFSFFREAMLSGREVTADELLRIGAVHQLVGDSADLDRRLNDYLDKLQRCAPQSAAKCKELVKLAWMNPGGSQQDQYIEKTFDTMMAPGSEGEYGIQQFQKKNKNIDWAAFWSPKAKL